MKYSVCIEGFFPEIPVRDRIPIMKEIGFDGGELWRWRENDLPALRREAEASDFRFVCMVGMTINPGLSDRETHPTHLEDLRASIDAARELNCPNVIAMAGNVMRKQTRSAQHRAIIDALQAIAPYAEKNNVTLVLELLNSLYDHPQYLVDNSEEMGLIVRAVGHPCVKGLYDIYHAGIMEGNIIEKIRSNIDCIGHFHAAGIPGRNEPASGEQNYPAIVRAIEATGYTGWFGLEYRPLLEHGESLRSTLRWISGGAD